MRVSRSGRLRAIAGALLIGAATSGASAAAVESGDSGLDHFLSGLKSLRATFTETVTDAHGLQTETGAGTLVVVRPDRFRWDYRPNRSGEDSAAVGGPSGQLLVADGRNLWFYDRELAQVSVKPVASALSATPIMLLSGSPAELHASFEIGPAAARDGLDWVEVRPRGAESDFSLAELGFARERLARMIVHDRLGQTVQLDFSRSERNATVDAAELQFTPPPGVDVIGTPQP